jgi:outer membrane immunogenic protein
MRKIAIGAATIFALTGTPALAADLALLPLKTPYNPPAVYNWTSCYGGINGGGARSENNWQPFGNITLGTVAPTGFFGGGQVGCDYQVGPLVFGVEGQFEWVNAASNTLSIPAGFQTAIIRSTLNMFGTVEGRVGYAFDRVLPYVKAGLGGARFQHEFDLFPASFIGNQSVLGIAAGAGFEVALLWNMSAKFEYNFIYLGTNGAPTSCATPAVCFNQPLNLSIQQNIQSVMIGLNYRLGPAPPVSNY